MAFYCDYIFPLLNNRADPSSVQEARHSIVEKAKGDVLEIGFGTGKTLSHYTNAVSSLTVVEPSLHISRSTKEAIELAPFPVNIKVQKAEKLPCEENSFDTVLTSKVMCSVQDVSMVLKELGRVMKTSGQLLFLEHVKSREPRISNWQRRLNPLQKRIGCGCNLNRDIESAIEHAGFQFSTIKRLEGGPKHPGTRFMPIIAGSAELV